MQIFVRDTPAWLSLQLLLLLNIQAVLAKNECQPVTWGDRSARAPRSVDPVPPLPDQTLNWGPNGPKTGQLVCTFFFPTPEEVNYYECTRVAQIGRIEVEDFFAWNPQLKPDCSNIQPSTWYCIHGCKC